MSSPHSYEKRKLSKAILGMKFMTKSKQKIEKDEEEEAGKAAFASQLTEAMRIGSGRFIIERSFVPCEDLIVGRLSYHGMNPEIERLLELERGAQLSDSGKTEAEISDVEMAKHYSSMVETMARKFKTKAEKRAMDSPSEAKRPKFMKPGDD